MDGLIHHDRDVEGYPGRPTHGPLQALAIAEAALDAGCESDQYFGYRLTSPLFDYQSMAVRAVHGRQTAAGTLRSAGR